MQKNLFGEDALMIQDNPTLQRVAMRILELSKHYPEMFDGQTIGEVDRNIRQIVWLESGLYSVLTLDSFNDRLKAFEKWHADNTQCVDTELLSRARRYLVEHDYIRLSASAIRSGERHKQRLTRAFAKC